MEDLTFDSVLAIFLAVSLLIAYRMMPRIMAWGVPFQDAKDVKQRMEKGETILFIDVRSEKEFTGDLGHVKGALNLEAANLAERVKELGAALDPHKSEAVVVTCRTHNRSPSAARVLKSAGFTKVSVMKGGMMAWKDAGYPTKRRG